MERLTYTSPLENRVSKGACAGVQCKEDCDACGIDKLISRLWEYEETGLEPQEITALKLYTMGAAVAEIQEFDGVPIRRLQELAKAEKEGRVHITPRPGDVLYETDPAKKYRDMLCETWEQVKETIAAALHIAINAVGAMLACTIESSDQQEEGGK